MIINSQKRSFGRGAKVSLFTLGTMRATESLEKMYSIIKNAYYVGINHIETAPSYGDAESLIGNAIKKLAIEENIKEKNWVITSKVLPKGDFNFLKKNFQNSLKNLNREKINNLAIHGLNLKKHLKALNKKMKESASNLEFEEAAKIRDEIRKLETNELEINLNPKISQYNLNKKVYPQGRSTMGMPGTKPRKAIKKWKPKK